MLDVIGSHKSLFQVIIFLNFVPVHVMACPVNLLRRFLKLPNKLRPMDFDLKMFYFWESFEKKQKWKFLISKRFVTFNLIGRNLIGQERHLVCTRLKLKKNQNILRVSVNISIKWRKNIWVQKSDFISNLTAKVSTNQNTEKNEPIRNLFKDW